MSLIQQLVSRIQLDALHVRLCFLARAQGNPGSNWPILVTLLTQVLGCRGISTPGGCHDREDHATDVSTQNLLQRMSYRDPLVLNLSKSSD